MPKQSEGKRDTMERVMHEVKHGELETRSGRKVKSRKQAVAIGMAESGSSKQEDKATSCQRGIVPTGSMLKPAVRSPSRIFATTSVMLRLPCY